jgi:hypothetical protein
MSDDLDDNAHWCPFELRQLRYNHQNLFSPPFPPPPSSSSPFPPKRRVKERKGKGGGEEMEKKTKRWLQTAESTAGKKNEKETQERKQKTQAHFRHPSCSLHKFSSPFFQIVMKEKKYSPSVAWVMPTLARYHFLNWCFACEKKPPRKTIEKATWRRKVLWTPAAFYHTRTFSPFSPPPPPLSLSPP